MFDEVQQFPRARQLIKYLVADGRYDYFGNRFFIRLKKNVKDIIIPSEEEHLEMFPLDFEEFLWALVMRSPFRLSGRHSRRENPWVRRCIERS